MLRPAWRTWSYPRAAIVFGRSQRALSGTIGSHNKLEVVLRASGGAAVLVGPWMLGLSVALPTDHPLAGAGVVDSYRWLGQAVAAALGQIGLAAWAISPQALLADRAETPATALDWACFGAISPWEVLVGRRKIAGLAQVRRRHGILLVAGILMHAPPWELLTDCVGKPPLDAQRLAALSAHCAEHCPGMEPSQIPLRLAELLSREIQSALTLRSASVLPA